ncbi:hypothetical protein [Flagellimonas sp.]|uniref:hypothetical protein n=1 Tax=Flagellimonas sp. TaxID=2058762 RepID=UPI003B5A9C87
MQNPKFCFLALSFFLFIQCSKDNSPEPESEAPKETPKETPKDPTPPPEPEPIVYFTFTIDQSINTSEQDNWILIHDENGKLLDYKSYESGETLEFEDLENNLTENIHISLFHHRIITTQDQNNQPQQTDQHTGTTYTSIPIKNHWTHSKYPTKLEQKTELTANGEFSLHLSNFPNPDNVLNGFFSTMRHGNLSTVVAPSFGSFSIFNPNTNTLELNGLASYNENPNYLMTVLNQENYEMRYSFFKKTENSANLNLDYNEFEVLDNIYNLPVLPDNQSYLFQHVGFETETSFKSDTGYFILGPQGSPDLNGNGIPVGTLDQFEFYRTWLSYSTNEYSYHLNQDGPNMSIESYPEAPSVSSNGNINSFDFSTTADYLRREDSWIGSDNTTNWKVVCDANTYPKLSEFPEELITLFPSLVPLNDLQHVSTRIFLQGDTYDENLDRLFNPDFDHIITYGFVNEYFIISI